MNRLLKLFVVFLFCLLLSPSFLFADGDDSFYDSPGLDINRATVSVADYEHIDPYTGGLTLNFVAMSLQG